MSPYVYQEYPKCLYKGTETMDVQSAEEEAAATKDGWQTAAQHFGYEGAPVPDSEPKKKGKK